jgi:hypothetical protein
MKNYENDDDLERALFAMDLEEPPADLRNSILAATIYHVPVAATVPAWEPWLYGGLCAALVWLLIAVIRGGTPVAIAESYGAEFVALVSQPATLFWIAVGGAATFFISQMNLTAFPGVQRAPRR